MLKRLYIIILLVLTGSSALLAQTTRLFEGDVYLGSSMVNDLLQDRMGRIWIATQGGLTRYDSHEFRTFTLPQLTSDQVQRICEDRQGRLFVGTAAGLQRFDPATGRFTTIHLMSGSRGQEAGVRDMTDCFISAIRCLAGGDVLVATTGYGIFTLEAGNDQAWYAEEFVPHPELTSVRDIAEAADGTLWFAAGECGLLQMKGPLLKTYLKGHNIRSLCLTDSGSVYASEENGSLYRYDAAADGAVAVGQEGRLPINRIAAKKDGSILIATDGRGVLCWTPVTSRMDNVTAQNTTNAKVGAVLEDRDGNLWMGINQRGLLMERATGAGFGYIGAQSGDANVIGNHAVSAVHVDREGTLWVGTDGDGLYKMEPGKWGQQNLRAHFLPQTAILSICEDRRGQIYIGTWLNGCGRIDKTTGAYEQLACTQTGDAVHVMSMVCDGDDNLWIGTNGDGLKCLNLTTRQLQEYRVTGMADNDFQADVLSNSWVNSLTLSPDSLRLYIGMSSSMGCLDLRTRSFVSTFGSNCLLSGVAVNRVCEDRTGVVWAATTSGLYRIMSNPLSIVNYQLKNGLPSDNLMSMEMAADGSLWIGTSRGLCHFNPVSDICANYFRTDGLQGNEFFKGASTAAPDGRLAFGGIGGLTLFSPQEIVARPTKLSVKIVGLEVSGEEVNTQTRSGWYQVCDTIVSEARHFDLAHNDNSLTLSFSTMDYARADGLHYEYRIGADSIWQRLPMGVNVLTLSHLAPDTYPISIRAVTGSTVSEELTFTVVVHPAWYASIYAKIVYCLMALLMIVRYLRRRRRAEQQRLRVQEHIHAAQMREIEEGNVKEVVHTYTDEVPAEETIEEERREKAKQTVEELVEKPTLQAPDERLLERVMKVVNAHITDSDLSVEQIANEVGLSRSHLHRKMKELTGESTSDFVRNVRLKRAAYLLEGGKHSIAEVMYACGFDSPPGFSTRFKNFYGVSPTEYMKEHSYSKN